MKLKLQDMFKSASGKVCQDSDFYTTTRNGKTYTGRICHPNPKASPAVETRVMAVQSLPFRKHAPSPAARNSRHGRTKSANQPH